MVAAGQALVYSMGGKYSHFVIDLKNLTLKDKFLCHRFMGVYPFQMTWPPAGFVAASTCEISTYPCGDAEKQHEASSSGRKRKHEEEMPCDKETTEPNISTASLKNESSEEKFCYIPGPYLN